MPSNSIFLPRCSWGLSPPHPTMLFSSLWVNEREKPWSPMSSTAWHGSSQMPSQRISVFSITSRAQPSGRISKLMSLNYLVSFPPPSLFCGNIKSNPGPDALDDTWQVMANNWSHFQINMQIHPQSWGTKEASWKQQGREDVSGGRNNKGGGGPPGV